MSIKGINYQDIPRYGHHISHEEFIEDVEDGIISMDEGHGFYATDTMMSDVDVKVKLKKNTRKPDVFTHVWWFSE